jgi:hypothetical protein
LKHEEVIDAVANWFKADRNVVLIAKGYGRGFPNPDVQARYRDDKVAFVECKPSDAGGREYLTGIGQCIAYLTYAEFAYLALPEKELKEYQRFLWVDEIGLLSVKPALTVQCIRPAKESKVVVTKEEPKIRGYGYYRDLRPLEIHAILKVIHSTRIAQKKLNVNQIKEAIWQEVARIRNIKSQRQRNSWILNINLLLRDLQLININDYSLTEDGFRLLQLGDLPDKKPYLDELARCFLINANYLDILTLIQELNDKYRGFKTVTQFKEVLAQKIIEEKLATEKTNVIRDLQDIPRILRDLDILSGWRMFELGYGQYVINWKRALAILGRI